jgi:hypothetical protein
MWLSSMLNKIEEVLFKRISCLSKVKLGIIVAYELKMWLSDNKTFILGSEGQFETYR